MFEDLLINVRVNQDGVRDGVSGINNSLRGLSNSFSKLNRIINVAQIYAMANALSKCITSTMEMTETVNLFNVSMGDMAVSTNNALTELSGITGLDMTNLQNSVGTFSLLARSMGMTTQQSSILATNTNQLALDLSSLTNVPIARVMQDLRSGLLGQSETVYKYGMDVTEAGIKTEAMRQGIGKSVRDMSQGEKMALRYSVMIRQSGLAQGDFAKTIETPANQLRILSERFITLGRSIGSVFMPLIGALLPYLNALVSILIDVMNAMATFFGFEPPKVSNTTKDAVGGMDAVGDSADKTTGKVKKTSKALKDMKNALMGFDEINLLPKDTPSADKSGSGSGANGGGVSILPEFKMPSYDSLMEGVKQKSDEIKQMFEDAFSKINFNVLKASFENLWFELQPILDNIGTSLKWVWDNILVPLGAWTIGTALPVFVDTLSASFRALNPIMDAVGSGLKWLWDYIFKPILAFTGKVFIDFLLEMNRELIVVGDWCKDNKPFIEGLVLNLGSFAIAWGIVTTAMKLWNIIGAVSTVVGGGLAGVIALLSSPITMVVLAIGILIAIGIALYKNWDTIKIYATTSWNAVVKAIHDAFTGIGTWFATTFTNAWNGVTRVFNGVGTFFGGVWTKIRKEFANVGSWFQGRFTTAWTNIRAVFNGVGTFFGGVWTIITGKFTKIGTSVGNAVSGAFKSVINGILSTAERFLNGFIHDINSALNIINRIPAVNIPLLNPISIPRLARGGMIDGGGMFQAGENGKAEMIGSFQGKTTVMPLENTSFVSAMATAVYGAVRSAMPSNSGSSGNSNSNVPRELVLKVGSTEFGRVAIDSINKITKQDGRLTLNI